MSFPGREAKALPCIVLARPMTPDDPCLLRTREGFALQATLSGLQEAGLVSYCQMWCTASGGFPDRSIFASFACFLSVDELYSRDQFTQQLIAA